MDGIKKKGKVEMAKTGKTIIVLHILLMMFSVSGVFSKMASGEEFLSIKFIMCYGVLLLIMFIYAIGWQQVIKRLPLTTAYANRAITVVWGIVWGALFFREKISVGKVIGAAIVIAGVVMYVIADAKDSANDVEADKEVGNE